MLEFAGSCWATVRADITNARSARVRCRRYSPVTTEHVEVNVAHRHRTRTLGGTSWESASQRCGRAAHLMIVMVSRCSAPVSGFPCHVMRTVAPMLRVSALQSIRTGRFKPRSSKQRWSWLS